MDIKLELFRVFKIVCENKSITKGAEILFISQSAVSQAIKQLENQTGVTLFNRSRQGLTLTFAGEMLYEYASSAIDLLETAGEKLTAMKSLEFGTLKIAASDTISQHLLLPILEKYSKTYPEIKLQIVNRTSVESVALLKSGKVDLAFVNMPIEDDEVEVTPYFAVHDIFVAEKNSPYFSKKYSLKEIAEMPLILLEEKANSRKYVQHFFAENGIIIKPEIELGSHELLLLFAQINLGVSCVIKEFSTAYMQKLRQITTEKIPPRNIGIAKLKGVSIPLSAEKLEEMCQP